MILGKVEDIDVFHLMPKTPQEVIDFKISTNKNVFFFFRQKTVDSGENPAF